MLRKLFLSGWYILVMTLILLAIVISVMRGYPSIYQHYLPAIQEKISSILGKPVQVDAMRIDWYGITPQITAKNLSIYEDEDNYDQLLNVDQAVISVDVYRSIINKSFVFKEITFDGGNLEAVRTADEGIILNGIDISERLAARKKSNQSNKLKINLLNSSISIIDEIKTLDYFFDHVDVVLGFSGDRFKVSSKFVLPKTLGDSLTVTADIHDLHKGHENIKGKFYGKGENINLELLHDFFPSLQVGVKQGISDFQVWGNLNSLKNRRVVGSLALHDLVYQDVVTPIANISPVQEITTIGAQFRLTGDIQDWHLALNEVEIQSASQIWPGKQYEISCVDCLEDDFIFAAAMDYVNSDQLLSTMQHFPYIAEKLNEVLANVEIHGVLQKSQVLAQLKNNQLVKYAYNSSLQQANLSIPGQEFSVDSITGNVIGNHRNGSIDLVSSGVTINVGKILNQPLENHNIKGVVNWQYVDGKLITALQKVIVESNEMTASLQGMLQMFDKKPFVDIQIEMPHVQADTIKQYFPYKKMKPKLSKWLGESITAGTLKNGKLLFHGNPKNFPFNNKPGRFEITANIEDGILNYRPNWPIAKNIFANFTIKNNHLEVNASKGKILESSIKQVHAKIDDLKIPILVIDGTATGPVDDIFKYLRQSSILPENSKVIKHITASGNTKLDLNIVLTLTKKLEKQRLVSGVVDFDNAGLIVNALKLPFTNLNGELHFDKNGAEGAGLSAKLYGHAIQLNANKSSRGRTLLSISGDVDLDSYLSANYTKLNKYIKGIAPLSAEVNIPSFDKKNTDKTLLVKVNSDLYGVTTLLPEPFQKEFDETKEINIQTNHQKDSDSKIVADLENQIFLQAFIGQDTNKLSRMELRMGDEQFNLPSDGLKISGRVKSLNITDWKELMQSEKDKVFELKEIDVYVNNITLGNLELENVDFRATKNTSFWNGAINSSIAKGNFEYPVDSNSGSVATANFDYLRFKSKQKKSTLPKSTYLDPRTLPALVVNAKQFEYRDAVFNDVSLKTKPSTKGMTIDSLQGNGKDLQITANGIWEVDSTNLQNTNLAINLYSQNMQNSSHGLGYDSAVTGGEGSITANFSWPRAPYQFSLASVSGNAKLRFKEGTISSVDPGNAGRLIGLVNLSEITRRLSLDFTDFFSKGYAFEKIRGDLQFKDANLTTENLKIKGPSADLLIQGRTGIETKDYDQVITVTPRVSGGLPWIGLAVGGPLGAVGVIVGEKIAKSIGVDVNKVIEVKYSLKGSWDEPLIEPISQKVADKQSSPTVQGQPSPDSYPKASPEVSP
jgi:uncharacterized protein (TIGR02099 family)